MSGKRLSLTSWILLALAAGFFGLIGVLIDWGGRIEATLLIFGDPVYVALDAGRSQIAVLYTLPIALVAGAIATRKERVPR